MVKIGAELPKLFQNKTGYPFFWTTLYVLTSNFDMILQCRRVKLFTSYVLRYIFPLLFALLDFNVAVFWALCHRNSLLSSNALETG